MGEFFSPLAVKWLNRLVSPARACASSDAAVVIQADSSPSVDPFPDNISPFIENNQIILSSKCWLILPSSSSSSQHLSSSPSTFPKGLWAGKRTWCRWGEKRSMPRWLEIHSKLMANKDSVLLIFSPITLWWMRRCWGVVAGAAPAHFTWWNCLFCCQNNSRQICVSKEGLLEEIFSLFIITPLIRLQLLSELDALSS